MQTKSYHLIFVCIIYVLIGLTVCISDCDLFASDPSSIFTAIDSSDARTIDITVSPPTLAPSFSPSKH